MPPRKRRKAATPKYKPRRRGEPDTPPTVAKTYLLPQAVFLEIRRVAAMYGSQGRAVQVGSEILSRLETPLAVTKVEPAELMRRSYKLVPRTVQLIEDLKGKAYESSGQVLEACMAALKLKNLRPGRTAPLRTGKSAR